jgi:hypothetical protein
VPLTFSIVGAQLWLCVIVKYKYCICQFTQKWWNCEDCRQVTVSWINCYKIRQAFSSPLFNSFFLLTDFSPFPHREIWVNVNESWDGILQQHF